MPAQELPTPGKPPDQDASSTLQAVDQRIDNLNRCAAPPTCVDLVNIVVVRDASTAVEWCSCAARRHTCGQLAT